MPKTREPVLIADAVKALLAAAVGLGWLTIPDTTAAAVATAAGTVIYAGISLFTRRTVTPVQRPRDRQGRPLAPTAD